MTVRIENALPSQADQFFELWVPLMESLEKMGGDTKATPRSIDFFRTLFSEYASGRLPGVALLAVDDGEAVGALLWGSVAASGLDQVNEHSVYGWGAYTVPSHRRKGVSRLLREHAIIELDHQGIETAIGTAILSNTAGVESSRSIGFKPTQIMGTIDIHDEALRLLSDEDCGSGHSEAFYWQGCCPLCGRGGDDEV